MDTGRGASHTGVYWGEKGKDSGGERWGGIIWGEMPDIGDGGVGAANHLARYATTLRDLHMCPRTEIAIKKKIKNKYN